MTGYIVFILEQPWGQSLISAYLVTGYIVFILEQPGENHLPLRISWQDTLCLSFNNLETTAYHCVSGDRIHCVYPSTTWRQLLTTAYLVTGYIVFILELPGDNHSTLRISWQDTLCLSLNNIGDNYLPLRISWQDTLCLSLNNLETITYHCVSRDRIPCFYHWTIWRQSLTTAYLVTGYIVFIIEQSGDNYFPLRISWQDTLCLSLNNRETITYNCVSCDRIYCLYPWTTWRQSLNTAYLVTGYIVFILEKPGDNHLTLHILWQDILCLSLNNLEDNHNHCVSCDRIHCVYPWTI